MMQHLERTTEKRQRAGAPKASPPGGPQCCAPASWSAVALYRARVARSLRAWLDFGHRHELPRRSAGEKNHTLASFRTFCPPVCLDRQMKIITVLLMALALPLYGEGVYFANFVPLAGLDAPVVFAGTDKGPGPAYIAQLFLQQETGSLVPLLPITSFRPAGQGAAAIAERYLFPVQIFDTTLDAGMPGTFIIRVWERQYSSYEEAAAKGQYVGQSKPVTVHES